MTRTVAKTAVSTGGVHPAHLRSLSQIGAEADTVRTQSVAQEQPQESEDGVLGQLSEEDGTVCHPALD